MKLSHYCSSLPILVNSQRKGVSQFGVVVTTRQLPCLNELYSLFYKNKVKFIPENIYSLLTPLAIAHWIKGDGAALNKGLVLCTDSFTLKEVYLLQDVLKKQFNLNSTIQGYNNNRPRIYIFPESMSKLVYLVKPYMLSSMLYKLHLI